MTGGGTGGHIVPHATIIEEFRHASSREHASKKQNTKFEFLYIGSSSGLEELFCESQNIPFKSVLTGKLRRYFSVQNLLDTFKIPIGILQSIIYIARFKPDVIFSKGGYVAIPVVIAGGFMCKKIVIHESDFTPGVATKISSFFANKICVPTEKTKKYFSTKTQKKVIVTGNPIRSELLKGTKKEALKFLKIKEIKSPVLLVMGGSTGALALNKLIWENLDSILKKYTVIHITGKGKIKAINRKNYFTFEYIDSELKDIYAITDIVICRSGAGTVSEINALGLPAIYVPLSSGASRGDQFENAKYMSETPHIILNQDSVNDKKLLTALKEIQFKKNVRNQKSKNIKTAVKKIVEVIINV